MAKQTKTTRISTWVYNFFTDKALRHETTLLKKIDELVYALHLIDDNEVILNEFLDRAYKEDDSATPRFVFVALNALMNYYNKLINTFNLYSFEQFVDRWNIIAYYINSHVYTNVLNQNSLTDKELQQRTESKVALTFLFGEQTQKIIKYANEIMSSLDPYDNATISKDRKALIMSKIFDHENLLRCLEDKSLIKKEAAIVLLLNQLVNKYSLPTDGKTAFNISLKSRGLVNKLAYIVFLKYKYDKLNNLPYFIDEEFLSELFELLYDVFLTSDLSDLYSSKVLYSALIIAQAVKEVDNYDQFDDSYFRSNLNNANNFKNLEQTLQTDINMLKKTDYVYRPEIQMKTPMHIVKQAYERGIKFIQRPQIKKILLEHLNNICNPIYHNIIKTEGKVLLCENDKTGSFKNSYIRIEVSMGKFCYTNLLLYGKDFTFCMDVQHASLEKIHHCITSKISNKIKIEEGFSFYYDSKDFMKLNCNQNTIFLNGDLKNAFIDVVKQYVDSDDFKANKRFDMLQNGLM